MKKEIGQRWKHKNTSNIFIIEIIGLAINCDNEHKVKIVVDGSLLTLPINKTDSYLLREENWEYLIGQDRAE